jgi:two-component system LytT family response regulator
LVVDDEPLSRSNVTTLLREHPDVAIIGECGSGTDALTQIPRLKPDVVFLDVEMPECDGFDVLEMLGPKAPPAVVFVTAYDRYAVQAFEAGALDYLVKPFDRVRFERALERAKERIAYSRSAPRPLDTIAIKGLRGITFVKIAEIDWIEASDYYSRLHIAGKSHLLRRSMAELEKDLEAFSFCRIHRSTIVNLDRVSALELNEHGEYDVLLADGTRHRLSRGYRRKFQAATGCTSP